MRQTVCQCEEPADALARPIRQVQPKNLNQQHASELFFDQGTAWLRIPHLLIQAFQHPANRPIRFFSNMNKWRQRPQEDFGMTAGQNKVAADKRTAGPFLVRGLAVRASSRPKNFGVDGRG